MQTFEPDPDWKRYPVGIPIAGFFGYWSSLYFGNDGENLSRNLHIATVVGIATLLGHCILSDSEEYRNALGHMLKKKIVDLTFFVLTYASTLGAYCYCSSYLLGDMNEDFFLLLFSSLITHLLVFKLFAPGIRMTSNKIFS